jgi:hypothetical protein
MLWPKCREDKVNLSDFGSQLFGISAFEFFFLIVLLILFVSAVG